jgi:hypothetical protein
MARRKGRTVCIERIQIRLTDYPSAEDSINGKIREKLKGILQK